MCTKIFASMAFFVFTKLLSRKGYFPVCPGGWNGWALYHKTGFISIFIFIYIFKLVDLSQQRIKIMYLIYGKNFCGKKIVRICLEFTKLNSREKSNFTYLANLNSLTKILLRIVFKFFRFYLSFDS